jgi:hypothetical protein
MTPDPRTPLERALKRILYDLRPYLKDVVVIGGWVPYLHMRYGHLRHSQVDFSLTAEVDVLLPRDLPAENRPGLAAILQESGFSTDTSGAVWTNDPDKGEKVEFMVAHQGTNRTLNNAVQIRQQPDLSAISLSFLEILQQHTTTIQLPVTLRTRKSEVLDIRIPTLGAYLVNKSATFTYRPPPAVGEDPKAAKDLVYIRDIMATGLETESEIARNIRDLLATDRKLKNVVDKAANNLDAVARFGRGQVRQAATILAERTGLELPAAVADIQGHLDDAAALLLGFRSGRRGAKRA